MGKKKHSATWTTSAPPPTAGNLQNGFQDNSGDETDSTKSNQSGGGRRGRVLGGHRQRKQPWTLGSGKADSHRKLLVLVEQLGDQNIVYPMVIALGDTKAGKSSVVSTVAGFHLPSAFDLCTRAAIRLHMQWVETLPTPEYTISLDKRSPIQFETIVTTDVKEAEAAIARAHDRLCGNQRISPHAVEVQIRGPNTPNLTMVDLPGVVQVQGEGEQSDLKKQIDALLMHYLRNPLSIILVVHRADQDFHNSVVLRMAKKADPNQERTLPILSQADRVPLSGIPHIRLLLEGRTFKTAHGFHLVRCMTHEQKESGMTMEGFHSHVERPFLEQEIPQKWGSTINMAQVGFPNLLKSLSDLYHQQLAKSFPAIAQQFHSLQKQAQADLDAMGSLGDPKSHRSYYFKVLSELEAFFRGGWNDRDSTSATALTMRATFENIKDEFAQRLKGTALAKMRLTADGSSNVDFLTTRLKQQRKKTMISFHGQEVFEGVIAEHISAEWRIESEKFGNKVKTLFTTLIGRANQTLDRVCKVKLCNVAIRKHLKELHRKFAADIDQHIRDQIKRELSPESHNESVVEEVLQESSTEWLELLSSAAGEALSVSLDQAKQIFSQAFGDSTDAAWKKKGVEVEVAIRAYGRVAAERLGDTLPIAFEQCVFTPTLEGAMKQLEMATDEELLKLLTPDAAAVKKRNDCDRQIDVCREAIDCIEDCYPGATLVQAFQESEDSMSDDDVSEEEEEEEEQPATAGGGPTGPAPVPAASPATVRQPDALLAAAAAEVPLD